MPSTPRTEPVPTKPASPDEGAFSSKRYPAVRRSGSTLAALRPRLPPRCSADNDFGDLHGVECGPFAQIVGDDPQVERMGHGRIAADAADIDRVLARRLGRGDVAFLGAAIDNGDARRPAQRLARLVLAERPLELDVDRLAMADEDRHPHAGRGHGDIGVEDLARLDRHLPFFLGVAVVHEDVAMRDHVERDLLREALGFDRVIDVDRARLVEEFVHRGAARPGNRLIRRHHDPFDPGRDRAAASTRRPSGSSSSSDWR